ncbi:hypothetical protein LIER_24907 [Lithospermum erythrorhizon]|uniref:Uncharacterized protein n=1 Tax=Lithospermum erythrorhizon TaxID=34254 RepID=A0AAV3R652_LITER
MAVRTMPGRPISILDHNDRGRLGTAPKIRPDCYIVMDHYFIGAFIATTYLEPLCAMSRQSRFAKLHVTPSQVKFSSRLSQELQRQIDNGRVKLEMEGEIKWHLQIFN